ncbi:hypothetical protein K450DRAFT_217170 [Umbelopsis ramanniana AG]|uniref:Uncharacterized protein n=1 Tax=Umbelopsis ramanniana AG TaxID=1314678 RepID=A0AAD5EIR7_UMBRA|nr:uncharacterized protein K450DRAFT_217170 [Umbelopsis ramanniana AG]KAI8584616.1 hypothetical protein K450DRAFT_217170 [Umbelopsis ramanniana AG]
MGLIDKIRTQYDLLKVEKYTKRRRSETVFEERDRDFYREHYRDGVYLHRSPSDVDTLDGATPRPAMVKRASTISSMVMKAGRKNSPTIKSSETYNNGTYGSDLR